MKKTSKEVRKGLKPFPTKKTAYQLKEIVIRTITKKLINK